MPALPFITKSRVCVCNPLAALHVRRTQKKEKQNKKRRITWGRKKKEMRKQNTGRNEWLVLQLPALKDPRVHCVFSRSTGQTGADVAAAARCIFRLPPPLFFLSHFINSNYVGPPPSFASVNERESEKMFKGRNIDQCKCVRSATWLSRLNGFQGDFLPSFDAF